MSSKEGKAVSAAVVKRQPPDRPTGARSNSNSSAGRQLISAALLLSLSHRSAAYHFHTHFVRLFSARPAARPGAETWTALDGWRGMLCLWMVAFHSFFYAGNFIHDDAMYSVGLSPALLFINLGFLPVDGFFVLTGFLIAYPLFKEEQKRAKLIAEQEKEGPSSSSKDPPSSSPWTFDLSTFYYRRVTRMLPSYILAVYFHCGLLFPGGVQHSMDVVRSNSFRNFLARVLPDANEAPNSCTPEKLFTNFTWMNHLMPFGGCMGWTWSFAMQFNFYLFFPLLWKWAHVRLARSKPSSKRTPSSFVLPFLYAFLVLSVLLRIVTFFQLRLFDLRHEEGVFLGFFWYSNTLTRGGAVVWGVLIAYFTISSRFIAYLREHLTLVRLGWCLAGVVVFLQMFWSRLFAGGNMVETPGWSALEQTQKLGGLESYSGGGGGGMWTTNPKVEMYWYHALFHMFVLVGSPLSNLLFAFLLPIIIHSIGSLGAAVSRLLSARVWYPVSTLSWWVYLVHPAIMMKFYALYTEHIGDLPASVAGVYANVAVQLVLSFSTALVAYVFIEQPLEILLRQGEAAQAIKAVQVQEGSSTKSSADASKSSSSSPRSFFTILRSVIFVYCCLCMVYIVLHHLAMYFAVTQLAPKPYIERADALPTTKH